MTRNLNGPGLDALNTPLERHQNLDHVHPAMFYPPNPGPYTCNPVPKSFLGHSIFRHRVTSRSVMSSEGMGSPSVIQEMEDYLIRSSPNPSLLIVVCLFSWLGFMIYSGAFYWI